ncbi:GtrA family protein [Sodalis sp. RH21]|uniref:GtrA family protein n=1 Tax=unclassified Sodalis (in: enterobacteria) TaxID=2636512 RepID=UPI0039B6C4BB
MLKTFSMYAMVGVINTLIHWAAFGLFHYWAGMDQTLSNFCAFCIAVTFSFFVNARFTFKKTATTMRYIFYIVFMGAMALTVGWLGDRLHAPAIITLIVFSGVSLICGFFYSKFIVFKENKA